KEMMKAGKVALGMNVRLGRSGDIARIAKSCGHDFIFIDGQHAIFTLETIAHIAHTALGCGITPLVRVRSVDDQDVQVLLDNGVDRIHIGANDLLTAMGKPGAFGDPEGAKVIDRVISVTAANGKIPGMGGDRNIPRQREYIRKGARFITTNSEIAFILAEGT